MKREILMILVLTFGPLTASTEAATTSQADPRYSSRNDDLIAASPEDGYDVEMQAVLRPEPGRSGSLANGIIRDWRDRVFKTLAQRTGPRAAEPGNDTGLLNHHDLEERSRESRIVTRIVMTETLKFAQENLPEIDKLVKALRVLEVSTEIRSEMSTTTAADEPAKTKAQAVRHRPESSGLFVKTGLRVPLEGGRLGLLSESEAVYGDLSTFLKVHVDGQFDNSVGMSYTLGRDAQLRVEQQVTHTASAAAPDGSTTRARISLVQFVCSF